MSLFSLFGKKQTGASSVEEALAGSSVKPKNRHSDKSHAGAEQLVSERKRARRRLIGAIAMVLAVIVGLPMVLDPEPKPLNKNISIQISAKGTPAISSESPEDVTHLDSSDELLRATSPASHSTSTVAPDPAPPDASTGNVSKSLTPKFSANENPTRKVPSISDRKESARALAILEGANLDSAASAKTPKGIVIQVGAFATQEKVNELRGKLTSAGIKSFTQKIATSSGNKIRVRIGPFSDKESAEKANANLAKLGFNGTLVAL